MASFRAIFIVASLLSLAVQSLGEAIVTITDSPVTSTVASNPATTSIFGGTLIISQSDSSTLLTLDVNLVAEVANANGNMTQIQEALGYGYHNALSKKFITIPVVAISAIIAYVSVLLAEDKHLITVNDGISTVEPISLGLSISDTDALAAAGPDPGILVITRVGSAGVQTVTLPAAPLATAETDDCPPRLASDNVGCNAPPLDEFCPDGQQYAECRCLPVYYNSSQIAGNVTDVTSGLSVISAMMAMSNAPTSSLTNTAPICSSTSSVYGCGNPCCICPQGAGVVAPFLTTTVSGSTTTNCAYTVQPTEDNCPAPPVTSVPSSSPTPTSTYCTLSTNGAQTTWFVCNSGGPYKVTSPGQVEGDATAPFNCKTPAILGWTSTLGLAPGCMCATTFGTIPTTSVAQVTSTFCNPSISAAAPQYSISSLGSGGTNDGLAYPFCVIKGIKVPECTQPASQCYDFPGCNAGYYIANGGTEDPSCG